MAVALERGVGLPTRDAGALTASLYKQHAGELLRFAWHRLGRIEDAEDAVQATFLSAHRVLQEGERVREPRAWLFRILRNECLTRIALVKRRGVHESLEEWHADSGPSVEEQFERKDAFDATVALLGTLPEQQREAMVLREWIGLSAIETSEVLETTPQGVDALVYRARKSLVAVPEVEDDSDCADVRAALAEDAITARTRAHLLRCRSCRAASRRLRSPEEMAVNGTLPLDTVASRLGESIPGFALGAGTAAVAAGGGIAAAASSIAGASAAVKVVVGVTATAVVAGGTLGGVPVVRDAVRPAAIVQQERVTKRQASEQVASGAKVTIVEAAAAQQAQPERATTPVAAAAALPAEAVVTPKPEAPLSAGDGATAPPQVASEPPSVAAPPIAAVPPSPAAAEPNDDAETESPPASAVKPVEVKKPEESKAPANTAKPVEVKKPEEAKAPANTAKPVEVKKPEDAKKPESAKPVEARKPEESKAPAGVAKPEEAKKPESAKPVEVKKPEEAKKPESAKPGEVKKPDEPKRSEAVPTPAAAQPVVAPVTAKPEAKPDKGKKQDDD